MRVSKTPDFVRLFRGPALYFVSSEDPRPEMPRVPDPRRAAVVGLIVTVLLVLGGVLLVHVLSGTAKLQDCVMSGRTNCAPIDPPAKTDG
ncbi:MAG TPA: hypothetical protein VK727_16435 [Steroidobacteraceae bacterium]|nr:hypothetical protein [Steroidobacteraceae bacterium]